MKRIASVGLLSISVSCMVEGPEKGKDPIMVSSPTPTEQITRVNLNETEVGYVKAGNEMAFRFLDKMYEGKDIVLSPLSLQYALAMAANGAKGETLQEIIGFLGYGSEGIDVLNAYCKKLLEQLPAVDLDVTLKLTDAILANDKFPLLPAFQEKVEASYYSAVENIDFSNPEMVATRINDWAARSTDGFIDKVLDIEDLSPQAVAYLMNALYFKARWAGTEFDPMFLDDATIDDSFILSDGSTRTVSYMRNMRYHRYAEMNGYKVLALPYAGSKFFMYILLPDDNDLDGMIEKLRKTSWGTVLSGFKRDAEVYVRLPKFDIENKYNLSNALQSLGVKKAFVSGEAEFGAMFQSKGDDYRYWIEKVIQKARISIDEWGTEAAAVTIVEMGSASEPDSEPKKVYFFADHPFVFLIGEAASGTILFEGAFTGKK